MTGYNGWTNYETWCFNLWIDNNQGSQEYWQEQAIEAYDNADADHFSKEANASFILRESLKDTFENDAPDLGACVWSDLLNAALSEVNWQEIAEAMIENVANEVAA